jgi:hypothetical protein
MNAADLPSAVLAAQVHGLRGLIGKFQEKINRLRGHVERVQTGSHRIKLKYKSEVNSWKARALAAEADAALYRWLAPRMTCLLFTRDGRRIVRIEEARQFGMCDKVSVDAAIRDVIGGAPPYMPPRAAAEKAGSTPAQSQRSGETGAGFDSRVVDSGEPKARPASVVSSPAESGAQSRKLAVVLWNDRHSDTTAHLFTDPEKAIEWAKQKAKEFDRHGDFREVELTDSMKKAGWVYYAYYSGESDGLRVVMVEVDKEVTK